jgi:hypothetical protein
VNYTTRLDETGRVHVNYKCPCGCDAGLMYDREEGPMHLGTCCCGRLLWVGPQAAAVVRSHRRGGLEYELDLGRVTLPWGEEQEAAL